VARIFLKAFFRALVIDSCSEIKQGFRNQPRESLLVNDGGTLMMIEDAIHKTVYVAASRR
jgi:hypothetical protein